MNNGNFQTSVQIQPAVAVAGNFASANPRASVNAGDGGLVAGANGLVVGNFAWIDPNTQLANSYTLNGGAPTGFVANELQSTISTWFDGYSNVILAGQAVTLYNAGDFWAKPVTQAIRGQAVFARYSDGAIMTGADGATIAGFTSTASSIAAQATTSVTASIAQTMSPSLGYQSAVMKVTAVGSGAIVVGGTLSGSGVVSGTTVLSQLPLIAGETAGGIGRYEVSIDQVVTATTITQTSGVLTVGGTITGTVMIGAILSGGTVAAGVKVTALGTGTGGAGTYIVSSGTVVASAALAGTGAIQTSFKVSSNAAAGELCKISTWG